MQVFRVLGREGVKVEVMSWALTVSLACAGVQGARAGGRECEDDESGGFQDQHLPHRSGCRGQVGCASPAQRVLLGP